MVCGEGKNEVSPAVDPAGTPRVPPAEGGTLIGPARGPWTRRRGYHKQTRTMNKKQNAKKKKKNWMNDAKVFSSLSNKLNGLAYFEGPRRTFAKQLGCY